MGCTYGDWECVRHSIPFRFIHRVKKYKKLGNRESDVSRTVPELFDIINYALYYLLLYALLLNHNFLITL